MTTSVQTPADLVNVSLARIGYKPRVGSLYDGSMASKKILDIYGQTRDTLLRDNDFGFAEQNQSLTLLKQAPAGGYFPPNNWSPAYPALPWIYEYSYPSTCLKVRSVKPIPNFVLDFDPQPYVFAIENDLAIAPPTRVILCNVPYAICTFTGRVTDLTQWESDAVELFAAELARRIAPVLVNMDAAKLEAADAESTRAAAMNTEG